MAVYRDWLPADNYSSIPNHWLRDYRLSYKAKGLISYIASHKPGYRLSMTQIIAESDDGKSAVYAAIKELTRYNYLITERTRGETGKLGDTNYRFGPAAYEQRYTRAWRTDAAQDHIRKSDPGLDQHKHQDHKKVSENQNVDPTCGNTEFPQLTTTSENRNVDPTCEDTEFPQVGTRIRFSTSGKSTTKKNSSLEDQFPEDKTPHTPHATTAGHASGRTATEGGRNLGEDKPQPQERADDVAEILSVRPDWRRVDVISVLDEVVSQGTSRGLAVAALRDLAAGRYGHTVSPRRLLANGPWFAPGATFAPAPSLSADDMCSEHRGQLKASCACCWGERLGAGADGVRERPSGRTTMPDSVLDLLPVRVRSSRAVRGGASR